MDSIKKNVKPRNLSNSNKKKKNYNFYFNNNNTDSLEEKNQGLNSSNVKNQIKSREKNKDNKNISIELSNSNLTDNKLKNRTISNFDDNINNLINPKTKNNLLENSKCENSNEKLVSNHYKQKEDKSLINLSCEALYYYLKEKGFISNSKILLLITIVYLLVFVTHSMHFTFFLFSRPLYGSYKYECFDASSKTMTACTSTNVCFCEELGKCVTQTYASDVIIKNVKNSYNFGDATYTTNYIYQLKYHFGEINNVYIYDSTISIINIDENKKNITSLNDFYKISVNYNYKKKDNFCEMIFYSFLSICFYSAGSLISEWIFGYYSDYIGRYVIISYLTKGFALLQVGYFFLFNYIEELNSLNESNYIWFFFSFLLGTCTIPLKNFIVCYFLELYPNKEDIYSKYGIIQSSTGLSYLSNFVFFTIVKKIKWIFVMNFILIIIFIFIFRKYFRENPRFFSEIRNYSYEKINIEYKKLAIMQILDLNQIHKPLQANNNDLINKLENLIHKKTEDNTRTKEDMIFNKDEIEKKIKKLEKQRYLTNKRFNPKKGSFEKNDTSNNCLNSVFNLFKKKQEEYPLDDIVYKKPCINKRRGENFSKNFFDEQKQNYTNFNKDILIKSNNYLLTKENNYGHRRLGKLTIDINKNDDINEPSMNLLDFQYNNDLYIKKYIYTYALVKLGFCVCFTSNDYFIHHVITNPNEEYDYRDAWFIFRVVLFSKLFQYLAGKLTFYINSRNIILVCLIIFGFILIYIDLDIIFSYNLDNIDYAEGNIKNNNTSKSFLRLIATVPITIINILFDISIVCYPPTFYRGRVMMKINLISNIVPLISFIGLFLIESWSFNIGIIALVILFLYFTRLNIKNLEILESRDEAYETIIKNYINKRISKIYIGDKDDDIE